MTRLTFKQRLFAKIAMPVTDDGCWLWTGAQTMEGYAKIRNGSQFIRAHRAVYEVYRGPIPSGIQLDHVCRVRHCVNPEHLRPITHKQNQEHRDGAQSNNRSSGVRGVSWSKSARKWIAYAKHAGRRYHGGYHSTVTDAAEAAKALRLKLFTHNEKDKEPAA